MTDNKKPIVTFSCLLCNKIIKGDITEIQELLNNGGWKEVEINLGDIKIWGYVCPKCYKKLIV